MKKQTLIILIMLIITGGLVGSVFLFLNFGSKKTVEVKKTYEEIVTKNRGSYIVKNMIYTDTSLDFTNIEKTMKNIRSTCKKPCKINLYSNREAYDLDIMAGESSFNGYTNEQKNYLSTHILAFWGIDNGDNIEYYPAK